MIKISSRFGLVVMFLAIGFILSACARTNKVVGTVTSPFVGKKAVQSAGIGVNSFLWRASLETLDFMPLDSADPYGGTIITGWHSNASAPEERFKATVYILDTRLRADGLKVAVFKEVRSPEGDWVSAHVDPDTEIQIENSILSRARELKIRTLR